MALHEHSGVYGAWLQDGRLVTVEKARGPYTGWLDLPGGSPEPGESAEETLRRELLEECGVTLMSVLAWQTFVFQVDRASDGSAIDFRHRAVVAIVQVEDDVRPVVDVEDVARVVLVEPGSAVPFTPTATEAMRLLSEH